MSEAQMVVTAASAVKETEATKVWSKWARRYSGHVTKRVNGRMVPRRRHRAITGMYSSIEMR